MEQYLRRHGPDADSDQMRASLNRLWTEVRRLTKQLQAEQGAPDNGFGTEEAEDAGGGGGNYYSATLSAQITSGGSAAASLTNGPDGTASGSITVQDAKSRIPPGYKLPSSSSVDVAKMGTVYQLVGWSCSAMEEA